MMETMSSHALYLRSIRSAHYGKYYKAPFKSKSFKTYSAFCSRVDERNTLDTVCSFTPLLLDSLSVCRLWFLVSQCVLNYAVVMKTCPPTVYGSFGGEMCTKR